MQVLILIPLCRWGDKTFGKKRGKKKKTVFFLLASILNLSFKAFGASLGAKRSSGRTSLPLGRFLPLRFLGFPLRVGPIAEEHDAGQHGEDQAGPVEEAQEEGNRLLPEGNFEMDRP